MTVDGKVLLAGASGFIGGALVKQLLAEGADFACLVRSVELQDARRRGIPEDRIVEIPSFDPAALSPIVSAIRPR